VPATIDWQAGPALVPDRALVEAVDAALRLGGRPGLEISVVVVDDPTLCELHRLWLDDPTPTDVISFDLGEDLDGPAGEVYVSLDCARRVATGLGLDPARELLLYVVHGVLHLCGFDDRRAEERKTMRAAERQVMALLGHPARRAAQPDP